MSIIKDLLTSLLVIVCIIIVFGAIFYDKISLTKTIPESEDYVLSKEMQKELKVTDLDDTREVIVDYYIDGTDLKKYEKTNEYTKGKSNPFADISDFESNDENNNNTSSSNDNSGFYEDDGTK